MSWYNQGPAYGERQGGGRLEPLARSFICFVLVQYIDDMYIIATTTFNIMIITKTDF